MQLEDYMPQKSCHHAWYGLAQIQIQMWKETDMEVCRACARHHRPC